MLQPLRSTYFVRQPQFQLKLGSVLIFILAALVAWELNIAVQQIFPSQNLVPFFARTVLTLLIDLALIYISFRLLKQNGLPKEALGLPVSNKIISYIFWGLFIGALTIIIVAGVLFICIPYHFVQGPADASQVLKDGIYYLIGNSLEELMFRGFLFIIISQLAGWRIAILVMALPFGLFHLQGTGLNSDGLKMVATTACYSFVFSLSYVLFRSMWAAISVHLSSNIFLHTLTGLDGAKRALFMPVFERSGPKSYDVGFIVAILSALIVAGFLYVLIMIINKKHNSIAHS
jgi:membrane protease YdiL (CAAX protease family)